jgi:hypothetical protein
MTKYLTAIDDDYETCERTKAILRIHCANRSPLEITEVLGVEPTKIVQVGVKVRPSGNEDTPVGKVNLWMLDSEASVHSKDLRKHLDWLLDQVEPSSTSLLRLRGEGLVMDVSCVWWSKFGEGGPTLWPTQMERLAGLDLELSIGFAFFAAD